jgi:parallel beta-helix repeat protein
MIDSYYCRAERNHIFKETYSSASGFQAIRVANCRMCNVIGNMISDSSYSAIWVHNGFNNNISENTILYAGWGSGGGSNINGISLDYDSTSLQGGRHTITDNKVFYSQGAGISIVEGITNGVATQYNAGSINANNLCMFNYRDGIAIYGNYHRIIGNTCESNGLAITDGIVGNGYNGIGLNGSSYCVVTNNSCMDFIQPAAIPLNLSAYITGTYDTPRSITHIAQTQNYGIVEYPGGTTGTVPADYNLIANNNITQNLANPTTPYTGGYHAYNNGTIIC